MERAVELDQQSVGRVSRIDAMQVQAMSQAVQRRRAARRVAIQQALKRMEEGEFGYCVECGEEIAPDVWTWTLPSLPASGARNESHQIQAHQSR